MATKSEKPATKGASKGSKKSTKKVEKSSDQPVKTSRKAKKPAAADKATETAAKEPAISTLDGISLPAASGKAGLLGGPKDRGVKPDDKLALPTGKHFTYERVHSLNPKSFYCAMRWEYKLPNKSPEEAKRWWANKKIEVTNPANGNKVIVRAVDYGPHENTGLTISLSPIALETLVLDIGGDVEIAFADQKAPTGVVTS